MFKNKAISNNSTNAVLNTSNLLTWCRAYFKSIYREISGVQKSFRSFSSKIGHLLWKNGTLCFIRNIAHRLPLIFPIFLAEYGYHFGRMLHLLRLSTNQPNFLYFYMMRNAAQIGHASSIEISGNQKEQCLVNMAGRVKLPTWVFPNRFWPAPQHVDEPYHAGE